MVRSLTMSAAGSRRGWLALGLALGTLSGVTVFAQQPAIQLRDVSGNLVSQAGVVVTAAIATGGGTLGGTATATTTASGLATFTNLSITGTIGQRTLSFSATGLASVTSSAITITAGAATQLTITTQPSTTAQSGVAFAHQPAPRRCSMLVRERCGMMPE